MFEVDEIVGPDLMDQAFLGSSNYEEILENEEGVQFVQPHPWGPDEYTIEPNTAAYRHEDAIPATRSWIQDKQKYGKGIRMFPLFPLEGLA